MQVQSLLALFIVTFSAGVFLWTYRESRRLLEVLIGATAGLEFGQVANVHLFTVMCGLYLAFGGQRPLEKRWTQALLILGAAALLSCTVLIGDLVNSRTLGLQLLALAASATIIVLRADKDSLRPMATGLLATCAIGSVIAIGQRVGVVPYTPFEDPNQLGRVKGIWHEPDWLGMFAAIGLLLLFQSQIQIRPLLQTGLATVFIGAMILASARAAWLGLVAVGLVVLIAHRLASSRSRRHRRNWRLLAVGLGVGTLVLAVTPDLREMTVDRFGVLTGHNQADVSVVARQNQNDSLREMASTAPWYGHGLSSAGRVMVNGGIDLGVSPNNVASNWVLGWWIDGKLLAVPLIALLLGSALLCHGTLGGRVLLLVLVASLASNAIMVPITWFALGTALAQQADRRGVARAREDRVAPLRSRPIGPRAAAA